MKTSLITFLGVLFCFGQMSSSWAAKTSAATPAQKPTCINSDPTFKEILDHFSWRSNDLQFKPDFCDPKNLAYRLAQSVLNLAIFDIWNSKRTPSPSQGVLSSGPFKFFSSRIQTFVFEPNVGTCAGYSVAYVHGIGNGIMHVCQSLATQDNLTITSALVHEARHQDQDGFYHTACTHGLYAGTTDQSCDASFSDGGAYAVQIEYFLQLTKLAQLDPALRQSARSFAISYLVERFNTLPLGIQKGAVLVSDDSKLLFYNGETAAPLHPLTQPKNRIIKEHGTLQFYDSVKKTFTGLADGINPDATPSELASESSDLIDFYENAPIGCILFSDRVACSSKSGNVTLPIKDFTPIGFLNHDPLDRSDDSDPSVYIVSKEQRVYQFSLKSKTLASAPTSVRYASSWNEWYILALGFNGRVIFVDKDPQSTQPYVAPPGINPDDKFTQMISPYYWSKKLQEL